MQSPAVAIDFGTTDSDTYSRTSSEFEEVPYPSYTTSAFHREEELPLHYMSEETARRRTVKTGMDGPPPYEEKKPLDSWDDDGKKLRPVNNRVGSGRLPQPLPPPATNLVCAVSSPRSR